MCVAKKFHWVHTAGTDIHTYYFSHNERGLEALKHIGILKNYRSPPYTTVWSPILATTSIGDMDYATRICFVN